MHWRKWRDLRLGKARRARRRRPVRGSVEWAFVRQYEAEIAAAYHRKPLNLMRL
jgi:hypothetical protein